MMVEPALITARVTAVLEKLKVRYLIGGSLASTLHGMVRTTQDSDLVADLRQEHVGSFLRLLQDEFYNGGVHGCKIYANTGGVCSL
jgi:hypothetical protein